MTKTATINGKLGDVNDVRYTLNSDITVTFDIDDGGYSKVHCADLGIVGVDTTDAKALDEFKRNLIASYETLRMRSQSKQLNAGEIIKFEDLSKLVDRKAYDPHSGLELSVR